jgi:hypothetical protein
MPEPLDLLVVHHPALGASIVVGGAKPAPRMIFGVLAQPGPQAGIGFGNSRCGRLMAWRWVVRFCPVTRQAKRCDTENGGIFDG